MKNSIAMIALIAAMPGFALAQTLENNDNNIIGVKGDLEQFDDNDNSVFVQDDVDGDIINLDFDDVFDVDDDFIDDGNFNIAENLISIDDISLEFTQINSGLSSALSVESIANTVLSATAVNTADIDGSINIASIGQSTSNLSNTANGSLDIAFNAAQDVSSTSNSTFDGGLEVGAAFIASAPALELEGLTLIGSASQDATDSASIGGSYATDTVSTAAESTTATVQAFGDVASVAAGALNTATFTVSETAGTTLASSAGETLTTLANASDEIASGSGLIVTGDAFNTALINGSITADLNGGDVDFTSIKSVAAGALNTVTVDAGVVGRVFGVGGYN